MSPIVIREMTSDQQKWDPEEASNPGCLVKTQAID